MENLDSAKHRSPKEVLKEVFGYDTFRPMQNEVITNVLNGKDTLAVMPTGGGKSICYEVPALIFDGLTVVISPLIALMQDQVNQLETYGVDAVLLNSSLSREQYIYNYERVREGLVKLLYISPESVNSERIRELLHDENIKLSCITIDEAHCISQWGHDFRPDYLEIALLRNQFPHAVCLALTATATKQVQQDIIKNLNMINPCLLVSSFNRPNIYLEVKKKDHPIEQICAFIKEHMDQCGIIYCFSRRQVDELTQILNSKGLKALNYHAGLSDKDRSEHQNAFINDKVNIMVATLAFGMGINKPDVRYVIHMDMPKSIEQYYQEIGRAGRDGEMSSALLLFSLSDLHKIRFFFENKDDSAKDEKLLQIMIDYAQTRVCRRQYLLSYFGETYSATSVKEGGSCCDVCDRGPFLLKDVTIPMQKYLSCILRTRERYGASYIIDILLGSKNQRIIENGHDKLSTWGIGCELKRENWFELSNSLVAAGYLERTSEHNVLFLTEFGHQALRNRDKVMLPVDFNSRNRVFIKKKSAFKALSDDENAQRIMKGLRFWRTKTADEMNIPPYVIFGDKTLEDIAVKKPSSIEELMDCYGIGESKAKKFGEHILSIVMDK